MTDFNGVAIIPMENWIAPDIIFSTDASLESAGGWSNGEFFKQDFPQWIKNQSNVSINELEMVALLIGLKCWIRKGRNCNFLIYCDNKVTVEVLNAGKAKNKFSQACLQEACYITAKNNAVMKVVHLEGSLNRIPDCLSRWNKGGKYKKLFAKLTDK